MTHKYQNDHLIHSSVIGPLVKNAISHNELKKFQTEKIQATRKYIEDHNGSLAATLIYSPLKHAIKTYIFIKFLEEFSECLLILKKLLI